MYSTPPIHSNLRPLRSYDRYAHVTSPTPRAVMAAPRAMLGPVMPGVRRTLGRLRGGDAPGGPDPPPCAVYCTPYMGCSTALGWGCGRVRRTDRPTDRPTGRPIDHPTDRPTDYRPTNLHQPTSFHNPGPQPAKPQKLSCAPTTAGKNPQKIRARRARNRASIRNRAHDTTAPHRGAA